MRNRSSSPWAAAAHTGPLHLSFGVGGTMTRPTGGVSPDPGDGSSNPTTSVDSFVDAKLHHPPTRADWVDREQLIARLERATQQPVTLIAAPAGYGKTTLLAQWLAAS